MNGLIVTVAGAGVGLGVWLITTAITGRRVLPSAVRLVPAVVPAERAGRWLTLAIAVGLVVGWVTGWPVAGIGAGLGVLLGPLALGGAADRQEAIGVAEAVASWTDMIRDTMAGAAGLEEAIVQTAPLVPDAISGPVATFAARLRHQPLGRALDRLAVDLAHPSADLLIAALAAADRLDARDLTPLLTRLADAIRGDVRMRARVEVGRARIRMSARVTVTVTIATTLFLFVFARHLLDGYDTLAGQAWLAVVIAVWFGSGWLLAHYSRFDLPPRFRLRSHP